MASSESMQILDELLSTLESRLGQAPRTADAVEPAAPARVDAIDVVLAESPRASAVVSLRDAPVVESFRQALADGLIRVDTVNRLLTLINEVVVRLMP